MITKAQRDFYDANGYAVIQSLFSPAECDFYTDHYMTLRAKGSYPGDSVGVNVTSDDPLLRFPRMIHMHHWDETSLQWLLDKRLADALTGLLGAQPLAVQTMLYFK